MDGRSGPVHRSLTRCLGPRIGTVCAATIRGAPRHRGGRDDLTDTALTTDEQRVSDLVDQLLADCPPSSTPRQEFLGRQFDLGLAWVHFPEGEGGLKLSPKLQKLVAERLGAAGAPVSANRNPIGYGMCAPTLVTWGTEEQKQRYLRPLFTCEEIWCQLFSEPGAGSDFAGLSARGVADGEEWIINGQKVWTTWPTSRVGACSSCAPIPKPSSTPGSPPSSSTCRRPASTSAPCVR
ncbi:MAG: acyl-CoA dehydrogenase family protein [Ilumatobacteraceae bacterium]